MSGLLLDTHVLVWVLQTPSALRPATRDRIADTTSDLVVSAVSAWEIATKVRIGRFAEAEDLAPGYFRHLAVLGSRDLPVDARHAMEAGSLEWAHRDPFDRLLVAQARLESLTLVTRDRAITAFDGVTTLW